MKSFVEERAVTLGNHIKENRSTLRSTAQFYGVSKSTVHTDVTARLPKINPDLYKQVRRILDINKAQRHIRGGNATRQKYILEHSDLQK